MKQYPKFPSTVRVSPADLATLETAHLLDARAKTAAAFGKAMLSFLGLAAFCISSLSSPDVSLIGESATVTVPFAGPMSFTAFMIMGPALLFLVHYYLRVQLRRWLEIVNAIAARSDAGEAAKMAGLVVTWLDHGSLRLVSLACYIALLPLLLAGFAYKAMAVPDIGRWVFIAAAVAGVLTVWDLVSIVRPSSRTWRRRAAVLVAAAVALSLSSATLSAPDRFRRPLNLFRADISGQWLVGADLRGADVRLANLSGATLAEADLSAANFAGANLSEADLTHANASGAYFRDANLERSLLKFTDLTAAWGLKCRQLRASRLWVYATRALELACGAPIPPFRGYNYARGILPELKVARTFYCGCPLDGRQVDAAACGLSDAGRRASMREWDHVVPVYEAGLDLSCWSDGDPACGAITGRRCCDKVSIEFRAISSDLHNLVPVSGLVNQWKSYWLFGDVTHIDAERSLPTCDLKLDKGPVVRIEPPHRIKGDIARIYFYMHEVYEIDLSSQQRRMFEHWASLDPPDDAERNHNDVIKRVQGNGNYWLERRRR